MTPTHITQTGVLDLIFEAGPVAKLILLLLFAASILCWTLIIAKWRILQIAHRQNRRFMEAFWNSKNVEEIMNKSEKFPNSPVASVFQHGIKELRKLSSNDSRVSSTEKIDNINRALLRATNEEISLLEKHLGWLATTASAAPFVGLFGTVWGIMNSFQNIGATGAANLAVVAPGISEALITTAMGIGAAIPAVVGYNYFAGQVKKVAVDIDCFVQDFINIVQRSLFAGNKKGP